jgi:hypothetical protein
MTTAHLEQTYLTTHELDIGTFRFYDELVIGQVKEGAQVTLDKALPLLALGWEQYRNKPVIYISDRKFSYSLDPTMHFETKKLVPYLSGYAWVVYNKLNEQNARLESRFLDCPTHICSSMASALLWASELLKRQRLD